MKKFNLKPSLALNSNLLEKTAKLLARNKCLATRIVLANNKNITPNIQNILAKDKCLIVRITLLRNSKLNNNTRLILEGSDDIMKHKIILEEI